MLGELVALSHYVALPMKSEPPTPTKAPDNQLDKCNIN